LSSWNAIVEVSLPRGSAPEKWRSGFELTLKFYGAIINEAVRSAVDTFHPRASIIVSTIRTVVFRRLTAAA
jgi:hypothetical protein